MTSSADSADQPDLRLSRAEITVLLQRFGKGDANATAQVMCALYDDLRRMAEGRMRNEGPGHTLEAAALVNELFVHMAKKSGVRWESRHHFLAAASQEMRRILVDYARARHSLKRGGQLKRVHLMDADASLRVSQQQFLEVIELLDQLETEQPRMAKVVEMRCFGGLTHRQIGEVLGIDERTAKRDWRDARAWLESQLRKADPHVTRRLG